MSQQLCFCSAWAQGRVFNTLHSSEVDQRTGGGVDAHGGFVCGRVHFAAQGQHAWGETMAKSIQGNASVRQQLCRAPCMLKACAGLGAQPPVSRSATPVPPLHRAPPCTGHTMAVPLKPSPSVMDRVSSYDMNTTSRSVAGT